MSERIQCFPECEFARKFPLSSAILCDKYHMAIREGDSCPNIITSITIDNQEYPNPSLESNA